MKFLLSFLLLAVGSFIAHAQSAPASFAYVLQADALAKSNTEAVANERIDFLRVYSVEFVV